MNDKQLINSVPAEGPGATPEQTGVVKPMIDGLDENYYVEIYNPLSVTFKGKVASSRPVHMPAPVTVSRETPTITNNEEDVRRNYGLDLRNPAHASLHHFVQIIDIPPGASIRLPGNEAQVIVRQLVNIIMDKEGNKLFKGDAFARSQVEQRIIVKQGTMSEFFTRQSFDARKILNPEMEQASHEPQQEQSFPGEARQDQSIGADPRDQTAASRPRLGRPPKATQPA